MLADTLQKIANQLGCIVQDDVEAIRADIVNPSLPMLLKCGRRDRIIPMNELEFHVASLGGEGDYLRYISIPLSQIQPWLELGYPRTRGVRSLIH